MFGVIKIWMDEVSGWLNIDEWGLFLGEFSFGDYIFVIYKEGFYEVIEFDFNKKIEFKEIVYIGKFDLDVVVSVVYFEGEWGWLVVKCFQVEIIFINQCFLFIIEYKKSKLLFVLFELGVVI